MKRNLLAALVAALMTGTAAAAAADAPKTLLLNVDAAKAEALEVENARLQAQLDAVHPIGPRSCKQHADAKVFGGLVHVDESIEYDATVGMHLPPDVRVTRVQLFDRKGNQIPARSFVVGGNRGGCVTIGKGVSAVHAEMSGQSIFGVRMLAVEPASRVQMIDAGEQVKLGLEGAPQPAKVRVTYIVQATGETVTRERSVGHRMTPHKPVLKLRAIPAQ